MTSFDIKQGQLKVPFFWTLLIGTLLFKIPCYFKLKTISPDLPFSQLPLVILNSHYFELFSFPLRVVQVSVGGLQSRFVLLSWFQRVNKELDFPTEQSLEKNVGIKNFPKRYTRVNIVFIILSAVMIPFNILVTKYYLFIRDWMLISFENSVHLKVI